MIYIFLNFPFFFFVKIGYTGKSRKGRAKKVDRDAPGIVIPFFFVPAIGALYIEKRLHRWLKPFRVTFYRGDGYSEWYWLPAAIPVLAFGLACWALYGWLLITCVKALFLS